MTLVKGVSDDGGEVVTVMNRAAVVVIAVR